MSNIVNDLDSDCAKRKNHKLTVDDGDDDEPGGRSGHRDENNKKNFWEQRFKSKKNAKKAAEEDEFEVVPSDFKPKSIIKPKLRTTPVTAKTTNNFNKKVMLSSVYNSDSDDD